MCGNTLLKHVYDVRFSTPASGQSFVQFIDFILFLIKFKRNRDSIPHSKIIVSHCAKLCFTTMLRELIRRP